ncbi:hypothetical protein [Actinoplanes sp. NPDC051494]|uniref:hypothetical protein n=1 Tax=Actinoplanes sp. NPDC051494 TaxID=3363907 RepID=UPI00379EB68A
MRRSYRRAATRRGPDRRVIAVGIAVLVAVGGAIGFTQISNADETKVASCAPAEAAPTAGAQGAADPKVGTYKDKDGDVQHKGDGQLAKGEQAPKAEAAGECKDGATVKKTVNGLEILANTCEDSRLEPHDGFQNGNRCVSTEFGEVGEAAKNATLLITESPQKVGVGEPFTLKVSTRNLIRDRFLAAGQGGYYVESSVLADGLVRGHFHTACRMLSSTTEAVDPSPVPAFFVATEDKKGGAAPDTVTIQVPGLPQEGIAQCASWAGDGSHRVPMMQRANQIPGIDAVRVEVGAGNGGGEDDGDNGGGNNGGGGDNGGGQADPSTPPAEDDGDNGGNNNGGNNNGGNNGGGDDDQPDPEESASASPEPETNTGTTPPKTPTVSLPPTQAAGDDEAGNDDTGNNNNAGSSPKPTKTKTTAPPAQSAGDGSSDDDEDTADEAEETTPAQNLSGGKTATPKASRSTEAAAATTTENDDSGAPDDTQVAETPVAQVQNVDGQKLALTGANVMTIALGGAILILGGLFALSVTRRKRAGER